MRMIMEFPRLVFRCPGPYPRQGGTYDFRRVVDADEMAVCVAAGWFETLPLAIEGKPKPIDPVKVDPAPEPAESREQLEEKARALGLKFDGRTSDAKLARMISEA